MNTINEEGHTHYSIKRYEEGHTHYSTNEEGHTHYSTNEEGHTHYSTNEEGHTHYSTNTIELHVYMSSYLQFIINEGGVVFYL